MQITFKLTFKKEVVTSLFVWECYSLNIIVNINAF